METNEAQVGAALRSLHSMGLDSLCYYEEVDRKAAGLERNSRTVGGVLCRPHAGLTGCNRNVKSRDERRMTPPPLTSPRSAVIFVEKAAAACAAPALKYFCSILHHNLAFTQNLGLTPVIGRLPCSLYGSRSPFGPLFYCRNHRYSGCANSSRASLGFRSSPNSSPKLLPISSIKFSSFAKPSARSIARSTFGR